MAWIIATPVNTCLRGMKRQKARLQVCNSKLSRAPPSLHALPSRRTLLFTAAYISAAYLFLTPELPASAFTDVQRFTFAPLNATVEYPKSWFRSQKKSALTIVNLKDTVAATVSKKKVELRQESDPFSVAFELVRDRVEEEGSDIAVKKAWFEERGALVFSFVGETLQANGDVVVRHGLGRSLKGNNEGERIVCIVTAPKEKWERVKDDAEGIVRSLKVE